MIQSIVATPKSQAWPRSFKTLGRAMGAFMDGPPRVPRMAEIG
jgi:hypothetical protein